MMQWQGHSGGATHWRGVSRPMTLAVLLGLMIATGGLYLLSYRNFLLFHSVTEFCSIGVSVAVFLLVWSARRFFKNACYGVIAAGLLAAGAIDLVHVLSYKGMGVIDAGDGNVPTQLWIAARGLQAVSFCIAPWLLRRKLSERALLGLTAGYLAAAGGLITLVFTGIFPDCFLPEGGLTTFKIVSEYAISVLLLCALGGFVLNRQYVARSVLVILLAAIALTIASELAFTLYMDVYGIANVVGHFLKLLAVYFFYVGLVQLGLTRPYDLLFHQQQQQQQELRAQRDRAEQYLQAAGTIMVALDTDARIKLINQRGCEVLGYDEDDMVGENWIDCFVPPDERAVTREVFRKIMAGEMSLHERIENGVLTAEGEVRLVAWHNSLLRDSKGEISGTLSSGEDITDIRQAAAERQRLQRNMQQTQKLESLGVLAGGIAHYFNNLLAVVLGNAELAAEFTDADPAIAESLHAISEASRKGSELTAQLLAYTGQDDFHPQQADIGNIVRQTDHLLRMSVRPNTQTLVKIEDSLPEVRVDPGQVRQMLLGLVRNAGEAIGDGPGKVIIRVWHGILGQDADDPETNAPPWLGHALSGSPCVYIDVTDDGDGMDEATLSRCFEPFFSTRFTGRGLGLAAVLGIVRKHGGAIRLTSALHKGTSATIALPTAPQSESGTWQPDRENLLPAYPLPDTTTAHTVLPPRGERPL